MYSAVRSSKQNHNENQNFTRQGSLRKVINEDNSKSNLFGRQNEDLNTVYQMYRQEYVILAEFKMVQTENINGVYVIPSRESSLLWFGVIYVRNGPYEDGVFRFNVILDEDFPDSEHPKVVFQSKLFHPVINPETNELNLSNAFPTWSKNDQHIWQVLKFVQWIFENCDSCQTHTINSEAMDLLKNNKEAFIIKAKELVKLSQKHLYDDPPTEDKHYITFSQYDPQTHDKLQKQMLSYTGEDKNTKKGLSWVLPGSLKPLGRPPSPHSDNES
ncbi:unnamed protein product [Brassicogethes aeneus]|uniref:UBC core domain-containing protein n=1 Tax=Brassicogethes aeneus TaxID=1431903 RepID=A0A9P0FHP9_BRAAE|nr:unnamed protein product [Brassicogethes aeneus]